MQNATKTINLTGKTKLELGAACGTFGHEFLNGCLITEKDEKKCNDDCEVCYVDYFCDATNTELPNDKFNEIYACNPFHYGFKTKDGSELFLKEVSRIIKNNGRLIVLSNIANPFAAWPKVKQMIERVEIDNISFTYSVKDIDAKYKNHTFVLAGNYNKQTFPTHQIEIHVHKI